MLLGKSSAREVRPAPWGTSVEKSWLFAGLTELPDTTGSQVGICVADCKMQANGVVGLLTRTPSVRRQLLFLKIGQIARKAVRVELALRRNMAVYIAGGVRIRFR